MARRLLAQDIDAVPAAQVAYLNELYSAGEYADDDHVFCWTWQAREKVGQWVRLSAGRDRMWLGLAAAQSDPAIDFDWRACSGDLRLVAWSASFHSVLEVLARIFGCDWIPDEFVTRNDVPENSLEAGFSLRTQHSGTATGRVALANPLRGSVTRRPFDADSRIQRLPLTIPVTVDRLWLSPGQLQDLTIGSVICIRRAAFLDIGARLTLRIGATTLIARAAATKLTIVAVNYGPRSFSHLKEATMSEEGNESRNELVRNDDHVPVDVAGMPVELCFHAGCLTTSYAEIRAVRPGYVFDLGQRLRDQTIDITANGALIGRGELVAIGEQIGVRLTALGSAVDPN